MSGPPSSTIIDSPDPAHNFFIPPPPPVPNISSLAESAQQLNHLGEPTFASLGLGGTWSPIGWIQNIMEFLHVQCDLPWFMAISVVALTVRVIMFPFMINQRRKTVKFGNYIKEYQPIQARIDDARISGDMLAMIDATGDYKKLLNEHGGPQQMLKMAPYFITQTVVFVAIFNAFRNMANLPVMSMQTGGLWWFTDLTAADPYCLLPLISALTFWVMLESGVEITKTSDQKRGTRWFLRIFPAGIFVITMYFPCAVTYYWCFSNFISLIQALLLREKHVKAWAAIPEAKKTVNSNTSAKWEGFTSIVPRIKETMNKTRDSHQLLHAVKNRDRTEHNRWVEAGKAPVIKTYEFDPTKVSKGVKAMEIKVQNRK